VELVLSFVQAGDAAEVDHAQSVRQPRAQVMSRPSVSKDDARNAPTCTGAWLNASA
jgi:hypothetical protein